ncbi:MAG: protease inhibitor I9 family protein, partial [Acidobacteria bacterium]|nr:protease inhibitor I9 family protein [Acidobacteriota bacterium]
MALKPRRHHTFLLALLFTVLSLIALAFGVTSPSQATIGQDSELKATPSAASQEKSTPPSDPADLVAFRESVGGDIKAVIVELSGEPGVLRKVAAEKEGRRMSVRELADYGFELYARQDEFRASLPGRGVRALMRETDVRQIDGSMRHVEYRFNYLLNGFVAFVATEDIERLKALPGVTNVEEIQPMQFHLDKAIDYSLGTQSNVADRRAAVYGANQEFTPATDDPAHPEKPRATKIDGFEGQNMNIAIIDSGVDYRHPMFGGIGQTTPLPRTSGQPESPGDNKKVIYYYALSSPGKNTDDFGHGTLVSSCAAGYSVDGTTPRRLGYGTGVSNPDGTPGTGIGPTPNGAQYFGT